MLNVPYIGPRMLTRGFAPSGRLASGGIRPLVMPNSVKIQVIARSAACHWSSSMVRGRKRWMFVPIGVTPPPIISAMDPVTTTAGMAGSSVFQARRIAPSVPSRPSSSSPSPVTTIGSSCGGRRVGVVEDRGHRQVLATDRAVDDDLQPLDGAEGVDRAPVAPGPIMILHQHQTSVSVRLPQPLCAAQALTCRIGSHIISSPCSRAPCRASSGAARGSRAAGSARLPRSRRCRPRRRLRRTSRILSMRPLLRDRGIDDLGQAARPGRPHQRPRRNQVGEVKRRHAQSPCPSAPPASCRWRGRAGSPPSPRRSSSSQARYFTLTPRASSQSRSHRTAASRAGGADIGHLGAAFDQQARDQQFASLRSPTA